MYAAMQHSQHSAGSATGGAELAACGELQELLESATA